MEAIEICPCHRAKCYVCCLPSLVNIGEITQNKSYSVQKLCCTYRAEAGRDVTLSTEVEKLRQCLFLLFFHFSPVILQVSDRHLLSYWREGKQHWSYENLFSRFLLISFTHTAQFVIVFLMHGSVQANIVQGFQVCIEFVFLWLGTTFSHLIFFYVQVI